MSGYLFNRKVLFFFSLVVFTISFSSVNAWSGGLKVFTTSTLTITSSTDQVGECIVANVGNRETKVTVTFVSNTASPFVNENIRISPGEIFTIDVSFSAGTEFFCRFSYFGGAPEIRGVAKVRDFSGGGFSTLERAEAR